MTNTKLAFEVPFLKNTQSQNQVTNAEFASGKAAIMAKYRAELNDEVSFHISGGDGKDYSKIAKVAPGGVERGEVGTKLEEATDYQLIGANAVVYYSVRRNNIEQGQSAEFRFSVAAS